MSGDTTVKRKYRSFTEAREFVRSVGLKSAAEWREWSKHNRPPDIPSSPWNTFSDQWRGFHDWLGTSRVVYRPFEEAREFVRSLGLQSEAEWREWSKHQRPSDIPFHPERTYPDEWRGLGDWLGTYRAAPRDLVFRPFEEAREFVRSLGLKTQDEWHEWAKDKRPSDIPRDPRKVYSDDWRGYRDWLGTEGFTGADRKGSLSELQQEFWHMLVSSSQTTHARFKADPSRWWRFHQLFRKSRSRWSEEPVEYVAGLVRAEVARLGKEARIVDLGCGQCLLREALPEHDIFGIDHVAYDDGVIACDMAATPLEDSSCDVAVFCLSLLGRNWPDYLEEARRILREGGRLFVVESFRRWESMGLEAALEERLFADIHAQKRPYVKENPSTGFVYASATKREETNRVAKD